MQTSPCRTDNGKTSYGGGVFAFMCAASLTGVLIGTMCFMLSRDTQADRLIFRSAEIQSLFQTDLGRVMAGSLLGSTVFLLGLAAAGMCAVGQPFEVLLLMLRGMGIGHKAAQLYSMAGRGDMLYAAGILIPGAVISTLALAAAAREAFKLSNICLRLIISGRGEQSLPEAVRLFGARLLAAEAVLTLAAGADTVCCHIFIEKLV